MGERHPKNVWCQQSLHKKYQAVCVFDYFSQNLLYASDMQITVIVFVVEVREELQPLFSKVSLAGATCPLFIASQGYRLL